MSLPWRGQWASAGAGALASVADRAAVLSLKALVTDGRSTGHEVAQQGTEQLSPAWILLKVWRVSSPPSSTEIHQHASSSPAQGALGTEKAPGPSSHLAPPSLTPSQPALQAIVGMLNPPLPACGGASDHKPGSGEWEGGALLAEVAQAPARTSGEVGCWRWPCLILLGARAALSSHPQDWDKTPLWECVDSHDFYKDHAPFVK